MIYNALDDIYQKEEKFDRFVYSWALSWFFSAEFDTETGQVQFLC